MTNQDQPKGQAGLTAIIINEFPAYEVSWKCPKQHTNFQTILKLGEQHDTCLKCAKHYTYMVNNVEEPFNEGTPFKSMKSDVEEQPIEMFEIKETPRPLMTFAPNWALVDAIVQEEQPKTNLKKLTELSAKHTEFVVDILETFDETNMIEAIRGMATIVDYLKIEGYDVLGNNTHTS